MEQTAKKKAILICDRCGGDKYEQKERTDPSDGTKLTVCEKCGYIMLSDGKMFEGKGRLPSKNSAKQIADYVKTLE